MVETANATDDLARLVKTMRDKQKEYFRTRSSQVLRESKDMEQRVDKAVDDILNKQADLFD